MPDIRRFVGLFFLAASVNAAAQQPQTAVVVRVVDSAGAPLAGVQLDVMRGVEATLASAISEAAGSHRFVVPRGADELQIVARKIGYQRGDHFFRPDRDSLTLVIRLRTTPHELPAVQVTATEDLKKKRFHVTADDIMASDRSIKSGLDVVLKMRPDMMEPPNESARIEGPRCGIRTVWVNGKRIAYPPIDPQLATKTAELLHGAVWTANKMARRLPAPHGQALMPPSAQSILDKIHPEHIEEMNFVNCDDTQSTQDAAQTNALFVVLKRGVAYDPVRGSYVLDAAALDSADAAVLTGENRTFRGRLLGVFDDATGEPIAGVDVVDVASGTFAKTTATGTVSLAFLPEGVTTLQLRHAAYSELKLDVTISPADTTPITLTLAPRKPGAPKLP